MNFAFVPLYIKYLGIEAYALVGIFSLLQAWLVVLDLGLKPTLVREMARFIGGQHDPKSIRELLRSVEIVGITIAFSIATSIAAASGWLASHWLHLENLPVAVAARAFTAMGAVTALRFVEDIYASCLAGLEMQVQQNVVVGVVSIARSLGAVGVLAWVSHSIDAFFAWQALVSVMTVASLCYFVYRALPSSPHFARPSLDTLRYIRSFAAGMTAITCLSVLLTQVDKILLSRLLTLKGYGYYTVGSLAANALITLTFPVTAAFYPRFTALATVGDQSALRAAYHKGAQLIAVFMGSAAIMLIFFGQDVLTLWTGDPVLVRQVTPIMTVLCLEAMLNGLMAIPYQMMLANGWTSLMIWINTAAVAILVPAIVYTVPRYGAIGAAWNGVALNAGYLIFVISLMHRRLLQGEKWLWYGRDTAAPLASAVCAALLCRVLMPGHLGRLPELGGLIFSTICIFSAAALAAPAVRTELARTRRILLGHLLSQPVDELEALR